RLFHFRNLQSKKGPPFRPSRSCQKKIGGPTSNRTSTPASTRSGKKSTMSASELTMSIQRFSRKNGGNAKVGALSTGLEITAGAVVGFRSLKPIMRGKKVSSI